MPSPRRFRAGPGLTLSAIVGTLILLGLGTWQVQRLAWKTALIAMVEARAAEAPVPVEQALADPDTADYRPVTATGHYRHEGAQSIGTAAWQGELGARLVTPLVLADGRTILVERGWLPYGQLPPAVPAELEPQGEVRLEGKLRDRRQDHAGLFTPANAPAARHWYWYDWPALTSAVGGPLEPLVLTLDKGDTGGELPRPLPLRVDLPNNHLGYAITWYGLAAALVAVYLVFAFRREE
ncbi:MAG: SURF1 family protein [Geminicoccaceae bacterium]